jgi:sec-independent protein translocase protein TatA
MFRQIGTGEIVLIVAVLVLFFGSKKLPDLARSIGKSARELRAGLSGEDDDTPGNESEPEAGDGPEGSEGSDAD